MSIYLLGDKLRDLNLLSKVHTSGLLMRHRNNEDLTNSRHQDALAKVKAVNTEVEHAKTTNETRAGRLEDISRKLHAIAVAKVEEANTEIEHAKIAADTRASSIEARYQDLNRQQFLMQEGLMGKVELSMTPKVIEVSHEQLNDAELGEVVTHLISRLVHPSGQQHSWIRGEQVRITLTPTIADQTVPEPVATDPVEIIDGNTHSYLTWGTGTGSYATGVAATGSITCVAGNKLISGQTVTIKDAAGLEKVFEFRSSGMPTGWNIAVAFTAQSTAIQVAAALRAAIVGSGLAVAVVADDEDLALTQNYVGDIGNNTITETVVDAGFVTVGFAGGSADKIVAEMAVESAHDEGDNKLPFGNFEVAPVTQIFVVR